MSNATEHEFEICFMLCTALGAMTATAHAQAQGTLDHEGADAGAP